ncbi:DUF6092 family protein [Paenibacillus aurantius]|uniref:DUF6092 family protein n=1 Tax=Paenibacillus aurantius TaxID=2918900 RepID=A0AA96LHQ4_9BACL|nr:DUF6092 family protein [Paenibacillus aurantius]WNQ12260.1 DUF6092 family protein [Paenibacillus aurantius]
MTDTARNRSEEERHERLLDFVGYVLTAARALGKEPASYGPMRLVDTLTKAVELLEDAGIRDESVKGPLAVIRENRWQATSDPEAFGEALDEAIRRLVEVTLEDARRKEQAEK